MSDIVKPRLKPLLSSVTAATSAGVPWRNVLRGTPPERFSAANAVTITRIRLKKKGGVLTAVLAESTSKGVQGYETSISFPTAGVTDRVKLSCNCADFVYRWEYALYKKGGADIVYGNGDAPGTTNPGMALGACKHLIALDQVIRERGLI